MRRLSGNATPLNQNVPAIETHCETCDGFSSTGPQVGGDPWSTQGSALRAQEIRKVSAARSSTLLKFEWVFIGGEGGAGFTVVHLNCSKSPREFEQPSVRNGRVRSKRERV